MDANLETAGSIGATYYVVLRTGSTAWNPTAQAWQSEAGGTRNDFDVAMTETPASSGRFLVAFPSEIEEGDYSVTLYRQVGVAPVAANDEAGNSIRVHWDGVSLWDPALYQRGTGARHVTITVDDGSDPLEGASVRVVKGAESYVGKTDADGEANEGSGFSLDDGTWTVSITSDDGLHQFTPTELVVDGDEDVTYHMTALDVPESDPGFVTGYTYYLDEDGAPAEGGQVWLRAINAGQDGLAMAGTARMATSGADGLVTFANVVPGAIYELRVGASGRWRRCDVPADATSPYALCGVCGIDEE
jgi:hypothetical protein